MTHLLLTIQWIDNRYHGLLDRDGPQEWPPSPFRVFQALVAGNARCGEIESSVTQALEWLQSLAPPIIIAPRAKKGTCITRFVPNNDGDKKFDRQERLTAKLTMPMILLDDPVIHYIWDISNESNPCIEQLHKVARNLICLGWGIDMAFADSRTIFQTEIKTLPGIRWLPKPGVHRDEGMLRTPAIDENTKQSTFHDLKHCYNLSLNRIEHGKPLQTVDKPKVFNEIFYTSIERPIGRPYIVFELRKDDGSFFRYPQNRLVHIAGMVRHLAVEAMLKSPPEGKSGDWIESYVAGHVQSNSSEHSQFSYLPLPSIGHIHTEPSVRRVMIAAPLGDDDYLEHLARRLDGELLEPTSQTKIKNPPALVRVRYDNVARFYTQPARTWASVTPVILPGHDDHKPEKTRKLIEKALAQAGVEQACEFEWSALSCFPKSLTAHKYDSDKKPTGYIRPGYLLSQTAVHLRIQFKEDLKVHGPLAIGAGRHCGLGLFAKIE
ncbi:MAG: type I-U CRISPR-associated protein Cas5/Cas6 [Candidatus Omnitrophica bacterium]|nr:type I-U CRISPR-associated protein Cas5/Cas6 [Candidatus Omnitrophota bacterium]